MSDQNVIVAMRTDSMATPHLSSTVKNCLDCNAEVWVADKQIIEPNTDTSKAQAICIDCYKKLNEPDVLTDDYREYLEALRKSGVTNMWGAPQYLMAEFGLTKEEALDVFNAWAKERI